MFENILLYFYTEPGRVKNLGRFFALLGGTLFLFSALGYFVTAANNLPTILGHSQPAKTLADVYPSLPLWWIPESLPGLIFSVLIVVIGFFLHNFGKNLDYQLR